VCSLSARARLIDAECSAVADFGYCAACVHVPCNSRESSWFALFTPTAEIEF
jgi:hypothetical protein